MPLPYLRAPLVASFGALVAALASLGCAADDTTASQGAAFKYPLDDTLRMNALQVKGTHNSYHIETDGNVFSGWAYTHPPLAEQLEKEGVRALELDLHYNFALESFSVYHEPADRETTCATLIECLSAVKTWSDAHPAHQPLLILLEPKDDFGALDPDEYFTRLEGEVLSVWPEDRLVTPALVQGGAPDLATAVADHGWPTLGEVRGRALFSIFVDEYIDHYTHGGKSLDGRLLFAPGDPGDPYGALVVRQFVSGNEALIKSALGAGMLVRIQADSDNIEPLANDITSRDAALELGVHFIYTDYPIKTPALDYWVEIPGGTPSRCNPVTAPSECTPRSLEDPAFVHP